MNRMRIPKLTISMLTLRKKSHGFKLRTIYLDVFLNVSLFTFYTCQSLSDNFQLSKVNPYSVGYSLISFWKDTCAFLMIVNQM